MNVQQLEKSGADANVSAPNIRQRNAKVDSLTGLRFIAALLVFMRHTPFSPNLPIFVQSFFYSGINGVELFFILSGFVLCYNYYDAFSKQPFAPTLKSFFVARFARIYPLHFLTFLLFFSSGPIWYQLQHFQSILVQITLTQAWEPFPITNFYNGPAWSISVEVFLYLCFPLLVLLLFKWATKTWHLYLIGFVAFSLIFSVATWSSIHTTSSPTGLDPFNPYNPLQFWLYVSPIGRLGDFILGCVAARIYVLYKSKPISPREQVLGVTLLLLSIAAVIVLMGSSNPFLIPYKLNSGFSVFFTVIIYTLARYVTPISRFLSTKLFVLLGEASYAFYLLHLLFIQHGLTYPFLSTGLSGDLYTLMEFLFIVVVSLGTYTYVETPIRKKIRQLFASKPRASAPASEPVAPTAIS